MKSFLKSIQPMARRALLLVAVGLAACGGGSDDPVAPAVQGATNTAVCGRSDNVKVGQVASLSTLGHRVSGKATIIDNCTIEITAFNYDGLGLPDVFVYGALAANYKAGFAIGPNLFGTPQTNTTLRVSLNEGDLNKLDGISIWCVRAAVSFGDGLFAKIN